MTTPPTTDSDAKWMQHALELARHGLGTTSPNPPVGAVIVREGHILGEGFHEQAGQPHAERRALANARERGHEALLRGSTLYVTLEPCSSYGRTPPCTEGIIEAGITRVVYGAVDPDPRHRGRAEAVLQAAGVATNREPLTQAACEHLLRPWAHAVTTGRPWVLAKLANPLDGRLTRPSERWLSGSESLSYAHQLRAESDAILVGGGTLRADDPALTIRTPLRPLPRIKQQPWRLVLTRDRRQLPANSKLFTDEHAARTLVRENLQDLRGELLEPLWREQGVTTLMLECGGGLLRLFLEQGLINEWVQVLTPYIGGGEQWAVPGGFLPQEMKLTRESLQTSGCDLIIRGILGAT